MHSWRECILLSLVEINVPFPQKIRHRATTWPNCVTSVYTQGLYFQPQKCVLAYVHSCSIHNGYCQLEPSALLCMIQKSPNSLDPPLPSSSSHLSPSPGLPLPPPLSTLSAEKSLIKG